jgi:hypothetical protein
MRPLLALHVHPDLNLVTPDLVADLVNAYLDREFGRVGPVREPVSVRALHSVEDLRAYQAGEMVLYRKPARKVGDRYVYEKDGVRTELQQLKAFD